MPRLHYLIPLREREVASHPSGPLWIFVPNIQTPRKLLIASESIRYLARKIDPTPSLKRVSYKPPQANPDPHALLLRLLKGVIKMCPYRGFSLHTKMSHILS